MRLKSLYTYIIFSVVLAGSFSSCKFEEEDIFADSPAVRMENALKNYKKILCSSNNGWVMEYFPTDTTEGYTFLMKFSESSRVVMAAKNRWINNTYTTDSCVFQMTGDNGPVLSFPTAGYYTFNGTQIGIFHLFANPEDPSGGSNLDGFGLQGDYEFIVLKAENNLIKLKGKKRGTIIYLKRLDENTTWQSYFDQIDIIKYKLFNNNRKPLKLTFGDRSTYVLKNDNMSYGSLANKFRIYKTGGDPITDGLDYSYIITPTGFRLHTAYDVNGQKAQTFVLSDNQQKLVSSNNEVSASISTEYEGVNFIPTYISTNAGWSIDLTNVNTILATHIATVDAFLRSAGGVQSGVYSLQLAYNSQRNSYVLKFGYKLDGAIDKQDFDFDITTSGDQITLKYKGAQTDGATTLLNVVTGVNNIITDIDGVYTINSSVALINPTLGLKLVKTTDTNAWLNIAGGTL